MEEKNEKKTFKDLLYETILPKVEWISLILVAISVLFKIFHLQGTSELLMISLSTYAAVCYLSAFEETELQGVLNKFIVKAGGIASAVVVIGMLFLVLSLPGGINMLEIGVPALCIIIIITFIKSLNSESGVYKKLLIRYGKTIIILSAVYLVSIGLS